MNKTYRPVPCSVYSKYELSILSRQRIRVAWRAPRERSRIETLRPYDLRTRRGAEYLVARNLLGQIRVLRLDRIRSAEVVSLRSGEPGSAG